jgi:carbonic anhydrase
VEWLVLTDRIQLSADQINAFSSRLNNNNRPVQKLNDRSVTKDARVAQAK